MPNMKTCHQKCKRSKKSIHVVHIVSKNNQWLDGCYLQNIQHIFANKMCIGVTGPYNFFLKSIYFFCAFLKIYKNWQLMDKIIMLKYLPKMFVSTCMAMSE